MIIEPVVVVCPHCNVKSSHYMGVSGTIHNSEIYTDGKRDVISGLISFDPFLIVCRECKGPYIFNLNMHEVGEFHDDNIDAHPDLSFAEQHPSVQDYKRAVKVIRDLEKVYEKHLRTLYWWSINDLIRFSADEGEDQNMLKKKLHHFYKPMRKSKKQHKNYDAYESWLEDKNKNLEELLKLLNPMHIPEDVYTMIEIQRELENFEEAAQWLAKADPSYNNSFIKLQEKLIRKKNPLVQKI